MRRIATSVVIALAVAVLVGAPTSAQSRKAPKKAPAKAAKAAPLAPLKTMTPDVKCPSLIGMGIKTVRSFCDVPAGRDPAQGIVVTLPSHAGPGTLTFDLHARHLYSEDEMKRGKAYAHYRAVIGVLTMKGDLLDRGAVEAEFRTAADLFDRIGGGAGPGSLKAVAPAGREEVVIAVPAGVDEVEPARRNARRAHPGRPRNRGDARPPGGDRQQPVVRISPGSAAAEMRLPPKGGNYKEQKGPARPILNSVVAAFRRNVLNSVVAAFRRNVLDPVVSAFRRNDEPDICILVTF